MGEGKSETEIEEIIKERTASTEKEVRDKCKQNISASLGEFAKADRILSRLNLTATGEKTEETIQGMRTGTLKVLSIVDLGEAYRLG